MLIWDCARQETATGMHRQKNLLMAVEVLSRQTYVVRTKSKTTKDIEEALKHLFVLLPMPPCYFFVYNSLSFTNASFFGIQ